MPPDDDDDDDDDDEYACLVLQIFLFFYITNFPLVILLTAIYVTDRQTDGQTDSKLRGSGPRFPSVFDAYQRI